MGNIALARDKIIVALDVRTLKEAKNLIDQLLGYVWGFKIGLQFMNAVGPKAAAECVRSRGGRLFIDGKIHDIPNTAKGAVAEVLGMGANMFNLHATGGQAMMRAAVEAVYEAMDLPNAPEIKPMALGVTILTSIDYSSLVMMGLAQPVIGIENAGLIADEEQRRMSCIVSNLAIMAKDALMDGVIASPLEIGAIRKRCGDDFLIVTAGVRPEWASADDQARVMTPGEAISAGADLVVIGRPIRQAPNMTPIEAANKIAISISDVM